MDWGWSTGRLVSLQAFHNLDKGWLEGRQEVASNNNNGFKVSLGVEIRHRERLFSPGTNNNVLLKPRREERAKVLGNRTRVGRKCDFRPERNTGKVEQELEQRSQQMVEHKQNT